MTWILASILVIMIGFAIFSRLAKSNREKGGTARETNYRTFFIMGRIMCLIGFAGIVTSVIMGYSFLTALPVFSIGLVYMILGWSKRDTWK